MTMDAVHGACDACQQISEAISHRYSSIGNIPMKNSRPWRDGFVDSVELGYFQDLAGRIHCTTCQEIVRAIIHHGREPPAQATLMFSSRWGVLNKATFLIETDESSVDMDERAVLKLRLYPIQPSVPTEEAGRIFGDQIELSLVRQWVNCCQASHGSNCLSSGLPRPSHQIYLIDVKEGCLALKPADTRYIALSYVWGDTKVPTTTKKNVEYLKKPGAIGPNVELLEIPKTIRDALRVVSLLDERYLWLDAFCIVQDDEDTKQAHLNSMASLYANSVFTIIAAEGDNSNHGLRGIPGANETRNVVCDIVRLQSGQELLAYASDGAWHPEYSTWESRAWTFQEALFSRRLLVFNGLVSWFCRTAIWEEHINKATEDLAYAKTHGPHPVRTHYAGHIPTWPDVNYWTELVEEFSRRKLTYDSDSVNAFAGAINVFNRLFNGGILWGMPEMFFDYLMLWVPITVLRRRQGDITNRDNYFPSWSWLGWEGDLSLGRVTPSILFEPTVEDQAIEIQPMIQWLQSKKSIQGRFPVNNIYPSLYQTYAKEKALEIPSGWTRHQDSTSEEPFYRHDELSSLRFSCPIPLNNKDPDRSLMDQFPCLFFKAQRAWFSIGTGIQHNVTSWAFCPARLVDTKGNVVGAIRLNVHQSAGPPVGETCELIALSLGAARMDGRYYGLLDEWDKLDLPFVNGFYKFYFVMWIEWKDGIAYRKAIGTVYKDVWESQTLEDVDIILG